MRAVTFDPAASGRALAGTDHGLYISEDAGQSWQYTYGSANQAFRDLASPGASVATGTVFFAALGERGVGRSFDGGITWSLANTGFPSRLDVTHVAVLPGQIYTVFAGTGAGVWKTVNQGSTWSPVALVDSPITALAAAPSGRSPIVAGTVAGRLAFSLDAGTRWQELTAPDPDNTVTALAIDPTRPNTWYVGSQSGGVWRTFNSGANWTRLSEGLTELPVRALRVHPANGGVYAGTATGVFFLGSGTSTWVPRNGGGAVTDVQSLALATEPEPFLLAGTAAGAAVATFAVDASGVGAGAGPIPAGATSGGSDGGGSLAWPWLAALFCSGIFRRGGRKRFVS